MRVVVAGAGGLGSKFGALLADVAEVWLLHHRQEYVAAVRESGLRILRDGQERTVRVSATADPSEPGKADLVLMMVKAYDTEATVSQIAPLLQPSSFVITLQNGLGNVERIAAHIGAARSVLGVTFQGATLIGPGVVTDTGRGPTYVGSPPGSGQRLESIAGLFASAGIPTEVLSNVDGLLWGKLAVVAGINAVATVLRVPNGVLGRVEEARRISLRAVEETMTVAAAKGVQLPFDPRERFALVTAATAHMRSGMLLDALSGRRTEVDVLSGAIAEQGRELGVPTPMNEMLWMLVKAIEATHKDRVESTAL